MLTYVIGSVTIFLKNFCQLPRDSMLNVTGLSATLHGLVNLRYTVCIYVPMHATFPCLFPNPKIPNKNHRISSKHVFWYSFTFVSINKLFLGLYCFYYTHLVLKQILMILHDGIFRHCPISSKYVFIRTKRQLSLTFFVQQITCNAIQTLYLLTSYTWNFTTVCERIKIIARKLLHRH